MSTTTIDRATLVRRYAQARRPKTELIILPNGEMTLQNAERIRSERGAKYGVIIDTNPTDVRGPDDLAALPTRYPQLRLRDHHGPSFRPRPVGQEDTTVKILLEELHDPDADLSRILLSADHTVVFTNQGNYDPDGVLSWAIVNEPERFLPYTPELIGAAWVTDHLLFGGRDYLADPDGGTLSPAEKLGYTLLQRQIEFNEVLVDEVLTGLKLEPSRDNVRSVFSGEASVYGPSTLQQVFHEMTADLPQILSHPHYYMSPGLARPWRRYYKRMQVAAEIIRKGMTADGLVATYRYNERPDFSYRVHCWLACGAPAPYAPAVPLQIAYSERTKQCVASVPYSTQRDHAMNWDLVPVMRLANAAEEQAGTEGRWGGRGSVVFRFAPNKTYAVTPERLGQLMHEAYAAGMLSSPKSK